MKERPILFSTPMIQAIMDGRKTQTRRIVKQINDVSNEHFGFKLGDVYPNDGGAIFHGLLDTYVACPYGKVGDVLWVRETWFDAGYYFIYRADCPASEIDGFKWRPSIFMPKEACRIKLEITNIRVERLQEISEEDACAEGINLPNYAEQSIKDVHYPEPSTIYSLLWENINGEGSWNLNPWVWIIEFKPISFSKRDYEFKQI